jgi:pyruvate-formate lyase-activating enzyme
MPSFDVLEPAIDPNNRISFLLDWELTMKCNLDCSYCGNGHDNSTKHPPLNECLKTLNFMFEYVDQYMKYKPKGLKTVILNVYGGESLHHPDVVKILSEVRNRYYSYKDRWHLTVTTTTNAIITTKKLLEIIPYIDEFTTSYHTESTPKQKEQFKNNLLIIKNAGTRLKCIVLMHSIKEHFVDGQIMIEWLADNNIKLLPRQLDDLTSRNDYDQNQVHWFNSLYQSKTHGIFNKIPVDDSIKVNLSNTGRACCGGRQTCQDQNYQERKFYVLDNKFTGWYCSVNWFFLYIKQVNGEVYVNKDCKMNFDGEVGPIGNLSNTAEILNTLTKQLETKTLSVIQCKKPTCYCGLCAPKAKELKTYNQIITKYQKDYQ